MLLFAAFICMHAHKAVGQNNNSKQAIHLTANDIKWEPIPGGVGGAMRSELWQDQSGAHGGMTKFPAGFKAPLHFHTNDIKMVVVKGAYIYNGKSYGPGSYLFIPGGTQHESGGAKDSETIFFMEQPGSFDIHPVEASK